MDYINVTNQQYWEIQKELQRLEITKDNNFVPLRGMLFLALLSNGGSCTSTVIKSRVLPVDLRIITPSCED